MDLFEICHFILLCTFFSILRKYVLLLWSKYLLWIWQHEQQTVNLYYYASISFTLKGNYYPIINHNFRTCLSCDPHIEKKDMILFFCTQMKYINFLDLRQDIILTFFLHIWSISSFIKSAMLDKYVNYNHGLCKLNLDKCLLKLYVEGHMNPVFYSKLIIELVI